MVPFFWTHWRITFKRQNTLWMKHNMRIISYLVYWLEDNRQSNLLHNASTDSTSTLKPISNLHYIIYVTLCCCYYHITLTFEQCEIAFLFLSLANHLSRKRLSTRFSKCRERGSSKVQRKSFYHCLLGVNVKEWRWFRPRAMESCILLWRGPWLDPGLCWNWYGILELVQQRVQQPSFRSWCCHFSTSLSSFQSQWPQYVVVILVTVRTAQLSTGTCQYNIVSWNHNVSLVDDRS